MEYNYISVKKLKNHSSPISSMALQNIQRQMNISICKIQSDEGVNGTGL